MEPGSQSLIKKFLIQACKPMIPIPTNCSDLRNRPAGLPTTQPNWKYFSANTTAHLVKATQLVVADEQVATTKVVLHGGWTYWGGLSYGCFSWESTWPVIDASNDGDVTLDKPVINGAVAKIKSYIIGESFVPVEYPFANGFDSNVCLPGLTRMSMLQYKKAVSGNPFSIT